MEELERVPELAAATRRLVADGWLTVRRALSTSFVQEDGPAVTGLEPAQVVTDPATWLLPSGNGADQPVLSLRATAEGRRRCEARAYPPDARATIHQLDLTEDEDRIRVCAMGASGWLTGPFGILADLPSGLRPDR
ncbi:hypothetical protein [Kitasatospora azatica]|uniref:hypothetical protein n=1 Tax=Kitasatospora azatica TaxID=58347 RepID=UPI0012F8AF07|nr:hypothetical protein [Kitasatospora azatica]